MLCMCSSAWHSFYRPVMTLVDASTSEVMLSKVRVIRLSKHSTVLTTGVTCGAVGCGTCIMYRGLGDSPKCKSPIGEKTCGTTPIQSEWKMGLVDNQ
jgi:hypothetical protein